jgi:hypothetical protein
VEKGTPSFAQKPETSRTSSSPSPSKRLRATTGLSPRVRTFSMCLARFSSPALTAWGSGPSGSEGGALSPPLPWCLSALTVATMTATSTPTPARRVTMSMNFSAPRSLPNPASTTA